MKKKADKLWLTIAGTVLATPVRRALAALIVAAIVAVLGVAPAPLRQLSGEVCVQVLDALADGGTVVTDHCPSTD